MVHTSTSLDYGFRYFFQSETEIERERERHLANRVFTLVYFDHLVDFSCLITAWVPANLRIQFGEGLVYL